MKAYKSILFGLLALVLAVSNALQPEYSVLSKGQDALSELRATCLNVDGLRLANRAGTDILRFAGAPAGKAIRQLQTLPASATPDEAARAYLGACGSLFGISDPAASLTTRSARTLGNGRAVVRYQQHVKGFPVLGGETVVNLDADGNVLSIASEVLSRDDFDSALGIDSLGARSAALAAVAKTYAVDASLLSASEPELWLYVPAMITASNDSRPRLVWRLEVAAGAPVRELVLVNARRGNVELAFNQVPYLIGDPTEAARAALAGGVAALGTGTPGDPFLSVYTMNGSDNRELLPGTFICDSNNTGLCPSETADPDAYYAYEYAEDTYFFFYDYHGRDSIDDASMELRSTVHFGVNYQNAFWNGEQMTYGDGFSAADDVVGHELTHGVTEHESGLLYFYQSGAINESFSDIWGEFTDLTNGSGSDDPGDRWKLGEDLPASVGIIRDMKTPGNYSQPDKMTSTRYYLGTGDNGGVHYNSGIANKAAYLLTDGDTFNNQTVAALGMAKVASIFYEVQTNLLVSGADYADLGDALVQGCSNLVGSTVYGGGTISEADCDSVQRAVWAVEMDKQPASNFNDEAPKCQVGQEPVNSYYEDFESNPLVAGTWSLDNPQPDDPAWTWGTSWGDYNATSGTGFLYFDDYDYPDGAGFQKKGAFSATMLNPVTIPANAYLWFSQWYMFETANGIYYDGGIVEYSTNGGSSWNDLQSLFDANGYNGKIASGASGNPLAGRQAFVGVSNGYYSNRANLSSLAGQNVLFRWRAGLDNAGYNVGWFLDDVTIYTCNTVSTPAAQESLAITYTGWAGFSDASAYGGTYRATSSANRSIAFTAPTASTAITLVAYRGPDQGQAKILIDGVNKGTLDLYAATPGYQYIKTYSGLTSKKHTITVTALGTKNASSSGYQVRVDAFKVGATYFDESNTKVKIGNWAYKSSGNAAGGSYRSASKANSSVVFTVFGDEFTLLTARGTAYGIADLYVDSVLYATIDLYNPMTEWQWTFDVTGLGAGPHTIELVARGTKNSRASASTVVFDGFIDP